MRWTCPSSHFISFPSSQILSARRTADEVELIGAPLKAAELALLPVAIMPSQRTTASTFSRSARERLKLLGCLGAVRVALNGLREVRLRLLNPAQRLVDVSGEQVALVGRRVEINRLLQGAERRLGCQWVARLHLKLAPHEVGVKLRSLIINPHRLLEEAVGILEFVLPEQLFAQLEFGFGEPELSDAAPKRGLGVVRAHRGLGAVDRACGLLANRLGLGAGLFALRGRG